MALTPRWTQAIRMFNNNSPAASDAPGANGPGRFLGTIDATDFAERFPVSVYERIIELRNDAADALAVFRGLGDQVADAIADVVEQEAHLRRLTLPRSQGGQQYGADSPAVEAQQAKLDRARAERKRLSDRSDAAKDRWQATAQVLKRAEDYLRRAGSVALLGAEPDVKRRKGESPIEAVERCRRRLRELQADMHRVRSAPLTSSEAKDLARAQIERIAESGRPDVSSLIETGSEIRFAEVTTRPTFYNAQSTGLLAFHTATDAFAFQVWINKDTVLAKVFAEIDAMADDAQALTAQERAAKEAEIKADMLATEREEEAHVRAAGVLRRPEADPRAVLGIDGPEAAE